MGTAAPADVAGQDAERNGLLEAALQYAGRGWRVFPLHTVDRTGQCTCGHACGSPGKHPRTRSGLKDATLDAAAIEAWWQKWPDANVAIATGSGLVVLDVDGPEGLAELQALKPLAPTLTARTGRGFHLFYAGDGVRSSARGKLHVRGEGGYVVAAPSRHASGRAYAWTEAAATVAPLQDKTKEWMLNGQNQDGKERALVQRQPLPGYLATLGVRDLAKRALQAIKEAESTWSPQEQTRIESALAAIPADGYESWFKIGMILQSLQWVAGDGSDAGLELWDAWSRTCDPKYPGRGAIEAKWASFGRSGRSELGLGTLFALAQNHGWRGVEVDLKVNSDGDHANVINGHASGDAVLPPHFNEPTHAIVMPDVDKAGRYKPTCRNVRGALQLLSIECSYDMFAEQPLILGDLLQQYEGSMSDPAILVVRRKIEERFNFDPGGERTRDAVLQDAYANSFNPVLDYLDALQWDGRQRLPTWLQVYMGADGGRLNAEIGAKTLVAAVRRARQPGTKFDQLLVLEGRQGTGKTTALRILAGPDHYSDQSVLAVADREQQEALRGVWIHEISELTGIRRAAVDKIKHFLSRIEDRARPAYGHFRVDLKRHGICVGTTNDDEYLKDETGNRRFWPVVTRAIDTARLAADRDQLWAEAAALESQGYSIELDRALWAEMAEVQEARTEQDVWVDIIGEYIKDSADVTIMDILTGQRFMINAGDISQAHQNRAARALKLLGFKRYRVRQGNKLAWRYQKREQGT